MTLFPFFPYEHTDGGECAARFINGVPCNARRRGEKPPQSRRKAVNGRVPPSSRKILLSAQKNFRESLLLLYHFPAPLGKPFAADFFFFSACGRQRAGFGRATRRQQRAAGDGGSSPAHGQGTAAKGGGATAAAAPRTGKGRQQRTAARRRQQLRAEARGGGIFDECRKIFRSYYTFLSKALTMAVFCGMMKKKAPFCTYLCGSVFLKGKHNAICDLNCALCGRARAGIRAVLRP